MKLRATLAASLLVCAALASTGCGAYRETLPDRAAMEQLLISTAADKALAKMPGRPFEGKKVFVDTANLDCLDKPYVTQRIRQAVLAAGASMAADRETADIALEAASGAMSVDRRELLIGIPAIPLPVPFATTPLELPELPLFKSLVYTGKAKLILTPIDTATNALVESIPTLFGEADSGQVTVLIFFSFSWSDLPKDG